MSNENFYQTLGVDEKATQDEIKKVYRKLSKIHHPDKGGNEDEFKKISAAYDVLGDEEKRRQYDNQRHNPFGDMGGGFNPFEDFFNGGMFNQRRNVTPDKVVDVTIGVLESYKGVDKTITYDRKHKCGDCNGNGGDKNTCHICNGSGVIIQKMGTGLFVQMIRQTCNGCSGRGFTYSKVCKTCNGTTTNTKPETITFKIPHGTDEGQFLKLQGNGDFIRGMYGDLVLRVRMVSENNFDKFNNDLIYNKYFDLNDLNNDSLEIPHPLGTISVKMPSEFDTSKPLRVKYKGFNGGDLFVKLFVKFKR